MSTLVEDCKFCHQGPATGTDGLCGICYEKGYYPEKESLPIFIGTNLIKVEEPNKKYPEIYFRAMISFLLIIGSVPFWGLAAATVKYFSKYF